MKLGRTKTLDGSRDDLYPEYRQDTFLTSSNATSPEESRDTVFYSYIN